MKGPSLSANMDAFPPYLFRELDRKKQEELKKGRDVISLAVGDPDLPTPGPIADFAALEVKKSSNHRYPYGAGSARLRKAIVAWHYKRHGLKLDPETEITVLIGSKEGLAHLPFALLDRGDTALIPDPAYPAYKTGVLLSGARVERLPLKEENSFLPDFGSVSRTVMRRAKMLFLNYPNNPTGATAAASFYKEAVAFAKKNDLWVAHDAAYSEIYFNKPSPSILSVTGSRDVAVEFYSLSKTYCMTGWRLGWLIGNARAVQALGKLKEHIDSGQFNAIQETAVFCLEHHAGLVKPIRETFKRRTEFFAGELKKAGWRLIEPEAAFFVWARPPVLRGSLAAVYEILEKTAVLATPGSGFGDSGEGFVRFSLCAPDARIKEAARRISGIKW
ncbi:MAG: aminotransferase class I/II-fold pyridoxal phosphate-dependent enzyme [Elusimicrobia bacterium]|nr:aminotransferase class I/II-fold pyridoxal phosphate-dependent enzyme [Elusimicrobiota bacterium]